MRISGVARESAFWAVLLLAACIHLPRFTTLTIRGEESRRAVIAREMIDTGDWIVPRTQGEVRLSRPPLQNWLIACLALMAGEMAPWTIRLPGVIATLLTTGLVYWSARQALSVTGAVVAASAYPSFFLVLEQGRTGETEPVFTLFVGASLLVWHGLWRRSQQFSTPAAAQDGWRNWAWILGGLFAALGMLTKGLQPPLYFFGSVWMYLLLTGQHRWLWHRSHFAGIATFVLTLALWQVPFVMQMGLENGWQIYFQNVKHRFSDNRLTTWVTHFLMYPPSVFGGCLAPWSVLLLAFLNPQIRSRLGARRDLALYLTTCVLVCLPSVWLPPEARPRYFMPLFPCIAVLVGLAAELLCEAAAEGEARLWTGYVNIAKIAGLATAAAIPLTNVLLPGSAFAIPLGQGLAASAGLLLLVALMHRSRRWRFEIGMQRSAVMLAAALGLVYLGPVITYQQQQTNDVPASVAALKQKLPADVQLASFGHVHHLFLHNYGRPVKLLPVPKASTEVPREVEYFCVELRGKEQLTLPFAWDEVATLPMDRNRSANPNARIVVGQRRIDVASEESADHE